ncbi:recombination protein O [Ligilactobacillus ruminis DPC 6832]|uniref:Recombination protein O n=1 Tax=Ligilactobacillus ruminis DPC 6832 TaxID=1402208 RepID=A0A837DSA3_9LACO|nr:recombination protein O [Ligilactobacillus ruminis DPC 6832]
MLNAYASYVLGLGEAAIKDDCILASQWYRKIERALQLIDQGVNPLIIVSIMEIQLLELFGVAPEWRFCAVCGNQRSSFDYSESYGGILCKNHWHLDQNRLHLDEKTMYFLRYLSDIDLDVLKSVSLSEKTSIKIKRALDVIYDDQVGLYVPARKFLNEMTSFDFAFEKGLDKTE